MEANNNGKKKAAILLISLGQEIAPQILKVLPDKIIQEISYEIGQTDYVLPEERDVVVEEFINIISAREYVLEGGAEYARDLLHKALGNQKAKDIIDMLHQLQQKERPFSIARKADPDQLTKLLIGEHPQIVALVMCYLQPDKAALVLSSFPEDLQADIAERIGTISRTSPSIINKIEEIMENKLSNVLESNAETVGGVKSLVDILNSVDRTTEKNILSDLDQKRPELAEEVKSSLFVFEDIVELDRASIQRILREVDNDDLVLVLKGASEDVSGVIFENLSNRATEMLKEDIRYMGPVRLSTVEEAQRKIVDIIRRLDETGEIIIERGDSDSIIS